MNDYKKVGLVLVNYRDYASRFLADCRDSLRCQDYPASFTKIYIVDNASTPQSEKYLRDNFPEAKIIIRSDGNYAAANNLGFSQAINDGCQYIVTVNMDTVAQPGWLSALVSALDDNPEAAIAQSKILLFPLSGDKSLPLKINSWGNIFNFLGFGFAGGYGQPDKVIEGYPMISGYASGCSFIMRASVWQKIGGYNEDFYMYHDDTEISLKARLAGYSILLAPNSVIYHKYEFNRSIRMLYYIERNRLLIIAIFYPIFSIILLLPALLFMQLGLLAYAIFGGWPKTALRVYGYFFLPSSYVKIYKQRRQIRLFRRISFKNLAAGFSGRIEFQEINNPLLQFIVNPILSFYWWLVKRII